MGAPLRECKVDATGTRQKLMAPGTGYVLGMPPTLIINPAADALFADFAEVLLRDGADTIEKLQRRLRAIYPLAVVHARELSGEAKQVWYVYRDGHWVDPRQVTLQSTGGSLDAHIRRGPAVDPGIDPWRRRETRPYRG
jgi:hypothetical protein